MSDPDQVDLVQAHAVIYVAAVVSVLALGVAAQWAQIVAHLIVRAPV
jgi:isoprenylcysteine carboxyl methyltransferase (ICMT) family protein YpbQ